MSDEHSEEIEIVPATRDDLDQITAWCGETFDAHAAELPFVFSDRDAFVATLTGQRKLLLEDRARPRLFVARAGGELIGYVHLQPRRTHTKTAVFDDKEVSISDIFVRADWRGKGVGRRLLDHALAKASAYRTTQISAHVWRGNAASQALFSTPPFQETVRIYEATSPGHVPHKDSVPKKSVLKELLPFVMLMVMIIAILLVRLFQHR